MIQHQLEKRLERMADSLKGLIYRVETPVTGLEHKLRDDSVWQPFENGGIWARVDGDNWEDFRCTIRVPKDFYGRPVLNMDTGAGASVYNSDVGKGPQFVVKINGKIDQAYDNGHRELVLPQNAASLGDISVELNGYYKPQSPDIRWRNTPLYLALCDRMDDVRALYFDLIVPLEAAKLLEIGDKTRENTLQILSDAVNLLDLRIPYTKEFHDSIARARAFLKTNYYDVIAEKSPVAIADCIGHTHIDVAWLWDLYQSRHKAVRSFANMLKLMQEYPDFKFMSSQPVLYQFVKEDQPELYERIKQAVKDGRWEPEGGMWVEADCNISGGEALVRQLLYGNEFFETEFGKRSRILWLPDVFGYSAALPQILKKSGIDYFMTSKLSWSEFNQTPYDTFMWKGIDGTEVLTHFTPDRHFDTRKEDGTKSFFTTYNANLTPDEIAGGWKRFQQKGVDDHYIVCYGFGDGGGGSTDVMIEKGRRMASPVADCPAVRMTFARDFFENLEKRVTGNKRLPKWSGELYLEYHRGTYTSQGHNKRNNRKVELALRDVEYWLTKACDQTGCAYPQDELREIWRNVLTLQFHDILPGSSIRKVYEDSDKIYADCFARIAALKESAINRLKGDFAGDIVLSNTLSSVRSDIALFDAPEGIRALRFANGMECPVQRIEDKYIVYVKNLAAMSDTPAWFVFGEELPAGVQADESGFETPFFAGTFNETMGISSLVDKQANRQLCKENQALNSLIYYENRPRDYDAWDVNIYYDERFWEMDKPVSIEKRSEGPVCTQLRVTWKISKSVIVEDITLYKDIRRIDFDAHVDWAEQHGLLKARFPMDIFYNQAQYDIQYGNVSRATHKNTSWDVARFESCQHKWLDVSEAGFGAAILNDCKYGSSVDENAASLTLIKSATSPDPIADQCHHEFSYALYPHDGDFRMGNVPQMAYQFNIPVESFAGNGMGEKAEMGGSISSFAAVDQPNVLIESVKKALHGEGTIIRLYECFGKRTECTLSLSCAPKEACYASLMEDDLSAAPFAGNQLTFTLKPYEILTIRIK